MIFSNPKFFIPLIIGLFGFYMVSRSKKSNGIDLPIIPTDTLSANPPALKGKLVYHSYSCYSCNDSKLYLFDFKTRQLTFLSKNWNITNPMNAHICSDGTKIVFMGMPAGTSNWDIYMYKLGSDANPVDLTQNSTGRDEDPKFSPDGSRIIFKQDGILKEIDTTGILKRTLTVPQTEASMPYYSSNSNFIIYAGSESGNSTLDIFMLSLTDGSTQTLSAHAGVEEYYPIVRDDTSFLFTRWNDPQNKNDQVYLGFFDMKSASYLPFNEPNDNFSDAFPVEGNTIVLSSTKNGGKGAYDLYIANIKTGKIWSLDVYNTYINTANNELGACYSSK